MFSAFLFCSLFLVLVFVFRDQPADLVFLGYAVPSGLSSSSSSLLSLDCSGGPGCSCGGESVGVDDIVFCFGPGSYYCAKIVHFFQMTMLASQDVLALAQMYEFVEQDSFDGRVSVHRRSETRACVAVECIHAVAACCLPQSADALRVVSPAWLSAKDGFTFS